MPQPTLSIYSDVSDSFLPHPVTKDLLMVTGAQSVVQSVMNLVSLNHYDIPFHPEIGGNVRKLLFELNDATTAGLLSEEIQNVLANFEPRVNVMAVNVLNNLTLDGFDVTIIFTIQGSVIPLQITYFLQRLR